MKQRVVVRIRRDDTGNWLATFPTIKGAHTYGRSLTQLRRRLPEVLRLWDIDPTRIQLVEDLEMPAATRRLVELATKGRRDLDEQSRRVMANLQEAIASLQTQLGLGVRDSGELLGVSPQYVHKLRRGMARSPRRRAASTVAGRIADSDLM